jgi:DNA-directed RNA polymerase specialized sigma24 family protein
MRRILVDHARSRQYLKRGGNVPVVSLEEAFVSPRERARDLVALDEARSALSLIDPRKGKVVEPRFFGGLTAEETTEVLKIFVIRHPKYNLNMVRFSPEATP